MHKILIVEDDKNILTGILDNLNMEGYQTAVAQDGQAALALAKEVIPDLIILDIMLPKLNGFEVCRELKKRGSQIPVIILSAKAQERDKVLGLELGADDYITKPFSPREFLMRVKAVLRRAEKAGGPLEDVFNFGDIFIDFKNLRASKNNKEIKFSPNEFKLLKLLVANRGVPVSRHKMLAEIWSDDVTSRTVDTHIWSLREKLEPNPAKPVYILTVHRVGYKFV
jgi:DNA-binding response OmpR family regulator